MLSVADWLGLDETLRGPWSDDRPRLFTADELTAMVHDRGPGLLAGSSVPATSSGKATSTRGWSPARPCSTWRSGSTTPASTSS